MYRKILVPLDGSPFSQEVLPLAIGVAKRCGAELRLVHVRIVHRRELFLGRVIEGEGAVAEQMHGLAAELKETTGINTVAAVLSAEDAVPELCAEIEREGIDLVVIATHGWGGIRRAWLGSVTDQLVRTAPVPILAVRPRGAEPSPTPPPGTPVGATRPPLHAEKIEHALITLDGSDRAEIAIEPVIALAGPDARYTLLRVVPIPIPGDPMAAGWDPALWEGLLPRLRDEAEEYLRTTARDLEGRVAEVETVVLVGLNAAATIIDYAAEHSLDLIAMATAGRGGIRRLAIGSVTDKVLRAADAPVLIAREPGAETA